MYESYVDVDMYLHTASFQKGFVVVDKDTHSAPKKLERKAWGWGADKKDGDTLMPSSTARSGLHVYS